MCKKLVLVLMMLSGTVNMDGQAPLDTFQFGKNKRIPPVIEKNVLTALSFYPELVNTTIDFIFKKKIRSSIMQAQPHFISLLRKKKKRHYKIKISKEFKLIHSRMSITQIPDTVMIGWIGHELGHILDYENKTNAEMVSFGYRYLLKPGFVRYAEMMADSLAVERGMGYYIIATKRFILDNADLPQVYKDKISRLYLSPDAIMEQVRRLEAKKASEKQQ